jgi:hypothetical protein
VVDPGGPATALLPRPAVWALARQEPWRPAVVDGVVDPEVAAVATRVRAVPGVADAHLEAGRRAELCVAVALPPGLDRAGLDDVLARVNAVLAADEVLAERVDSVELRVRPAG